MAKRGPDRKRRENYPAKAEAQRRRWADPEYRDRVTAAMRAVRAKPECRARYSAGRLRSEPERQAEPLKYSRTGIPTGYVRETAAAAWAEASAKADGAMMAMQASRRLLFDDSDTDAAFAKAVLHEAITLALGPTGRTDKMRAIGIVLDFTKTKPEEKRTIRAEGLEVWLARLQP